MLCKHKVNGKKIYVECKAQKSQYHPHFKAAMGTVDVEEYSEGWIITTSDFTKDAKGFVENWKSKPKEKSERLSFYSPEIIIEALKTRQSSATHLLLQRQTVLRILKILEIGLFCYQNMECTGVCIH